MIRHFHPKELYDYLFINQPILLDVREPWEYNICHLKDTILIPLAQIVNKADTLDKTKEYVLICHYGIRSYRVAQYLQNLGFKKLINLNGGIAAWAKEIDLQMQTY